MCSCADFEGYTPETHGLCPQRVDSILRQNSESEHLTMAMTLLMMTSGGTL